MPVKIEQEGRRLYFVGDTYAHKDAIKGLGAKWDADRRAWWVGSTKRADAERLLAEIGAAFDLRNATDRAVRADQLAEQGKDAEAEALRKGPTQRDPHDVRLTGKGTFEGRPYYLGPRTKDGARILILGLPKADGSYFERWVDAGAVEVTKTYQPRQVWDGRRYSGRTVTQYTTLGSIAEFLRRQQNPATRRSECTECGHWG